MTPITIRVNVFRYFYALTGGSNICSFEVKVTLCPESTCPNGLARLIGLRSRDIFKDLLAFEVNGILFGKYFLGYLHG